MTIGVSFTSDHVCLHNAPCVLFINFFGKSAHKKYEMYGLLVEVRHRAGGKSASEAKNRQPGKSHIMRHLSIAADIETIDRGDQVCVCIAHSVQSLDP